MSPIEHVPVGSLSPERFESVLEEGLGRSFMDGIERARAELEGRVVWNVNSTAKGGGVAEMLRSLLAYSRGGGVDARWVTIGGHPEFFKITKRLHNHLHGAPGDGGDLGDAEREVFERTTDDNAADLIAEIAPGDVVLVHDPQPAGLCGRLKDAGAIVIWRCHIGLDKPNDLIRGAWDFLRPYVEVADAYVFSRRAFTWEGLDPAKITVVPPSIDAFSPKNENLDPEAVIAILDASGVVPDGDTPPTFTREDGTPGRIDHQAQIIEEAPTPLDAEIVVQVSRWDRLKDPLGVIRGFADHVVPHRDNAHLIYAGPAVEAVADDPEGAEVLQEAQEMWHFLPPAARARIHLAALPMDDGEENAAIVNALQRRADVVVQKSIAEGFGLTVAEAMWKSRPVVASRIGGIQDQIDDGTSGILVDDPLDLEAYGVAVVDLLRDPERARAIGEEARSKVRREFLGARHLLQYIELTGRLLREISS